MIDNFALAVSHGLIALAVWILLRRVDLNHEPGPRDPQYKPPGEPGAESAGDA